MQGGEPVVIQTLIPESAIEAFDLGILRGLARLDECELTPRAWAHIVLTGVLVGAQLGVEGIPKRFLDGLENGEELLALAKKIGTQP